MEQIDKIVFRYFKSPKGKEFDLLEGYDATIYYKEDTPNKESIFTVEFWEDIAEFLDIIGIDFEVYEKGGVVIVSQNMKASDEDGFETKDF